MIETFGNNQIKFKSQIIEWDDEQNKIINSYEDITKALNYIKPYDKILNRAVEKAIELKYNDRRIIQEKKIEPKKVVYTKQKALKKPTKCEVMKKTEVNIPIKTNEL